MMSRKLLALGLLLAAIFAATVAYAFFFINSSQEDARENPKIVNAYASLKNTLNEVERAVAVELPEYKASAVRDWWANFPDGAIVSVPEYDYKIVSGFSPAIMIDPANATQIDDPSNFTVPGQDLAALGQSIATEFKKQGFSVSTTAKSVDKTLIEYSFYRSGETCTTKTNPTYYRITISCQSPQLNERRAAEAKPLIDAYVQKMSNVQAGDIVVGQVQIKSKSKEHSPIAKSRTAGYDLAEAFVRINDKELVALFYQNQSNGWKYITSASDEFGFPCDVIEENPEARKAMFDQVCYRPGEGQVRLDTNNRALQ